MLKPFYHCTQCKKVISKVEALYFVEDGSPRGFCTEECIEKYYAPIVKYFEQEIKVQKEKLGLKGSGVEHFHQEPHLVDQLLKRPDEIWRVENRLKEEYFVFIKHIEEIGTYLVSVCFVFNYRPSFILMLESTRSKEFIQLFRAGEKLDDLSAYLQNDDESFLEGDVLEEVEQKKSKLLAELLGKRKETDIPFESFPLYDEFFDETLHNPDEMYSHEDSEGDEIVACIKAHEKDGVSFFYFVLCLQVGEKLENVSSSAIFPVLGFPSLDGELYKSYQDGVRISGQLKS